ncbi:hypothetical protein JCM10212_004149 [Sporobolomyces blumeae]
MRLTSLVLVAGATSVSVLASGHDQTTSHHLEARDPHLLGGLIGGILGDVNTILGGGISVRIPSRYWRCSGSGRDGYSVDVYGHAAPAWVPSGWAYFGVEIGWAPTATWSCGSSWVIPAEWQSSCSKVTWWTPGSSWISRHRGFHLGFSVPAHWGLDASASLTLPSASWKCNGSGKDGFSVDIHGNGRPSWVPSSGWAYFGVEIGWAPTASWSCGSSWSIPSQFESSCGKVTWWTPSSTWISRHRNTHFDFSLPSHWGIGSSVSVDVPSSSWKCNGSGKDGFSVDIHGNGRPSWVPSSGWAYFGVEIGWAPTASWSCGTTWSIPTQWQSSCGKATWWTPTVSWVTHHRGTHWTFPVPAHWGCDTSASTSSSASKVATTTHAAVTTTRAAETTTRAVKTTTTTHAVKTTTTTHAAKTTTTTHAAKTTTTRAAASSTEECTTSKKAEKTSIAKSSTTVKKPSTSTTAKGGAHTTTTKVPATTTKPHVSSTTKKAAATTTHQAVTQTVTVPGDSETEYLTVTVTETVPASRPTATKTPSKGWQCGGHGKDGWEIDWQGNSRPSNIPSGWLWFGVEYGWAPPFGWTFESWTPSTAEIDVCGKVSWYIPPVHFRLPDHVACPSSWTVSGWVDTRIPSSSFQCDGSGLDGFDFDHEGNSRPSGVGIGWKWFGRTHGWQPCKWWAVSSSWTAPSWWTAVHARWWAPSRTIHLRGRFACPSWWSRSHVRGSFRWIL